MNQIPLSFEEALHIIRDVTRNLRIHNPLALRAIPPISTRRVESSLKKRTIKRFKPVGVPHLDREEVRCDDLGPNAG